MSAEPDSTTSHAEAIVAFARDLIAIPTENPPGAEYDACLERIVGELDLIGLEYEIVGTGDTEVRRRCILAAAGDAGPLVYLHGHYDVVPAFGPEQFEPRIDEGRLIGRGSSDMKGGLASIVYAALEAAELEARIGLVIVPDEETGGRLGAERLGALGLLDSRAAGAIVAEPTWGTIWHACRGAFTVEVTVRGRAAHVGLHYDGSNAFEAGVEIVEALRPLQTALRARRSGLRFSSSDPRASESILLAGGRVEGGTGFNVVPDRFSFTLDRRPNPDEDYEDARRELLDVLETAGSGAIDVELNVLQDARSAIAPSDGHFASALAQAVEEVTGSRPSVTCCPGVLEIRVYHELGIPAYAFGPGLIERMHLPDEDVPVANLVDAAAIYVKTVAALAGAG